MKSFREALRYVLFHDTACPHCGRRYSDPPSELANDHARFAEAWLGREVRESGEDWQPVPGGLSVTALAQTFGRSASWVAQMKIAVQVEHVLGLDLGVARARELAKLPAEQWRGFVYGSTGDLRCYASADGSTATVLDMTAAELRERIERSLTAAAGGE